MTIRDKKRERPDAAKFARDTMKKFPNVMAHLAEMERQEKLERTDETDGDETPEPRACASVSCRPKRYQAT